MAPKIILLEGDGWRIEKLGSGVLTPGMLVEKASGGFQAHSTADGNAAAIFVLENPWKDATTPSIDVTYAAGDQVSVIYAYPGALIYAWLSAGENVADGAYLSSDGAGSLQAVTAAAATSQAQRAGVICQADEAVNNGAGTVSVRIKARVL